MAIRIKYREFVRHAGKYLSDSLKNCQTIELSDKGIEVIVRQVSDIPYVNTGTLVSDKANADKVRKLSDKPYEPPVKVKLKDGYDVHGCGCVRGEWNLCKKHGRV